MRKYKYIYFSSMFLLVLIFINSFAFLVSAEGITTHLPPPPAGVNNFVVGYMPNLDTYRLGSTDYKGDIHTSDIGVLVDSKGDKVRFVGRYELVNGSWVNYTGTGFWSEWFDDETLVNTNYGKVIIFSSNEFYGKQGQLLASPASDDVLQNGLTLIGNQISSSKLLLYTFEFIRNLLPYILSTIVIIIGFYKAWRWLNVQFKGV